MKNMKKKSDRKKQFEKVKKLQGGRFGQLRPSVQPSAKDKARQRYRQQSQIRREILDETEDL